MRVVLVNTGHPGTIKGGAEAAVLDLARRLVARGHHVVLIVHHAGPAVEKSEDRGVRVYALPNRNLYFGFDGVRRPALARLAWHALDGMNPWMGAAVGRVLDAERPDVVNTHALPGLSQGVWWAARRRGIPVVHYLHEYGTMCPRGSGFRDGRACATPCGSCAALNLPRKALSRFVDSVVGVSAFTLQRHLDWGFFPNATRTVVPNVFEDLALHERSPVASGALRLGYFGRLIPDKGAHVLIEAVKRLPPDGWTLDVAGTGEKAYLDQLRRAAPPNVRFLGWTRPEAFFSGIDLLVVPSIWPDPQPRVVFEAFSYGIPVVGARAGGIPEQIDEGRTGWLCDPDSPDALATLLTERVGDRADRDLAPTHFAQRLEALDPDRVAARYEDVFEATSASSRKRSPALQIAKGKLAEHRENG